MTSDEWRTPPEVFAALSALYGPFDVDAACTRENQMCPTGWTREDNPASDEWTWTAGRVWCNPPYSKPNLSKFLRRGRAAVLSRSASLVCFLVPASTSAGWWHRSVLAPAGAILGAGYALCSIGGRDQLRCADMTIERLTYRGRISFIPGLGNSSVGGSARGHHMAVVFARPGLLPAL